VGKLGWDSDKLRKIVGVRTEGEVKAERARDIARAKKNARKAQKPFTGKP
jgi:hypothetical protein